VKKKTVKKIALFILLTFLVLTGSSAFASKPEVSAVYNPDTEQITVTWKGNTYNNAVICVPKYQAEAGGVSQRGYDSFSTGGNESGSRTFKVKGEHIHPTSNEVGVYLSVTGTSFGGSYSNISKVSIDNAPEHTGYTGEGATGEIRDETNPFLAALAMVVNAFTAGLDAIADAMKMGKIEEIIFSIDSTDSFTQPAPYNSDQWETMDKLYGAMMLVALALGILLIMITAYKFIYAGVNKRPEVRAEASESLWRWILVLLIIAAAPVVVRALFVINNALVGFIAGVIEAGQVADISTDFKDLQTGNVLVTALVGLMFAWNRLFIGLIFFIRNWVVWTIYVFTPIMAILWGINKNVTAAAVWLGEMLSNALLQTAYAFSFMIVVFFISTGSSSVNTMGAAPGWAATLIGVYMIPTLANILRNSLQGLWTRWAGFDEEGIARKIGGGMLFAASGVAGVKSLAQRTIAGKKGGGSSADSPSGGSPINLDGESVGRTTQVGQNFPTTQQGVSGANMHQATIMHPDSLGQTTQSDSLGATMQSDVGATALPSEQATTTQSGVGAAALSSGVTASPGATGGAVPSNRMVGALNVGRKTGNVAAKVVGTLGGVGAGLMPGGQLIVSGMARVAGGVGRAAGTVAGLGYQTIAHAKQSGNLSIRGIGSSFSTIAKEGTGAKSTAGAVAATIGIVAMDAISPGMTENFQDDIFEGDPARFTKPKKGIPPNVTPTVPSFDGGQINSLDSFRFR
jgi:hypothetical protein